MVGIIRALWWTLGLRLKSRERIDAENLALRHQLNIVCRSARKRVRLCKSDRLLFIWLYRLWPSVLDSVVTLILAGRTLQSGDYVGAVCGNRRCVRPGHLVVGTLRECQALRGRGPSPLGPGGASLIRDVVPPKGDFFPFPRFIAEMHGFLPITTK